MDAGRRCTPPAGWPGPAAGPVPGPSTGLRRSRRMARRLDPQSPLRFWLGMAQMFGAVAALVLLMMTGVSWPTIAVALVTTGLSAASRLLFRVRPGPQGDRRGV